MVWLSIPVRVCADNGKVLRLQAVNQIADCPQCAAGKGCGQNPWFRGFIGENVFELPRPQDLPANSGFLELQLSATALQRLTLMIYGLPLLSFLSALFVTQHFAAWLQFFAGLLALFISVWVSKNWREAYLCKHLQLALPPDADNALPHAKIYAP